MELVGKWGRIRDEATECFDDPGRDIPLRQLARHTPVFIRSAAATELLVRLPDGMEGFVDYRRVESLTSPLATRAIASTLSLRTHPKSDAPMILRLEQGSEVEVLGRSEDFDYVRGDDGKTGWLAAY